jgi:hypothetical protein
MFDGRAYGEEIVGLVRGFVEREFAPIKAENESLKARVAALEAIPVPEKGETGEKGQDGSDGVSPDPEAVAEALIPIAEQMIADAVSKAVAELPPPEKGDPGERGEKGDAGDNGRDGADGADGRGVKDLLIDREGQLVATMDDGEMKTLGPVMGKDGKDGEPGRDGFDLDDFDCQPVDERTIKLMFTRGETVHSYELEFPVTIYRGVFKAGEMYARGDATTWGGSLWIAEKETAAKPDTPESGWRLAVKKGRDGKDKTKD